MSAKKLLVADDSLTIQKVIRLAMSHEGYEIQAVSEGNEAIEQILLFRPKIVLIDVSLPGKSAIEVKAAIDAKPELAGTQFVLMSSAFETIDEAAIDRARFAARLTKPFDPAHLRKLVSDAFGEPSPAPSIVPPLAPPPFAPPPPLPPLSSSDDSDIRQLTQSTLKMAGLDDLEWSVNEPSRKDFSKDFSKDISMPSLPPLPSMTGPVGESLQLPTQPPILAPTAYTPPSDASAAYFSPMAGSELPPTAGASDQSNLETLVRAQVQAELQRLSKEMLPQLAEKILKQEISRLLSEIP